MGVVRELTENRSKLVCARTNLAEKLAEMQHEYMRLMRVTDLSRIVSKENVAKTAKVMKTLKQASGCQWHHLHLLVHNNMQAGATPCPCAPEALPQDCHSIRGTSGWHSIAKAEWHGLALL